ncbi:NAD(P)H-dependent oxidoreductase [Siphonobacter sp. SORGH_AS_0500]|uniref:FMN-dependent NADH-azoreductase n=1 Tax=Siphonobacter sp. SORGH_AS_0500 TaxID=1864824 RepID=UPI002859D1CE|nr:NAD(P)H-dependent oxidoreductase [Siphonobacter sp. SORGH_AS_0500]MDR6197490.1 FMN-dependent NADH-azoreductase [Siphonobacter sp. SORGH_AS_0500]
MKNILHIISSPQDEASVSRKLGAAILKEVQEKYPINQVKVRDLYKEPAPHLDESHINAFFTPKENLSPEQEQSIKYSDDAVAELMESDIIIMEAPMYNFNITSTLKAYFDHITRAGITFHYTGNGLLPEGLLKNKKAYLAITSGGVYSKGELKPYDFIDTYVRFFLTSIGIEVMGVFRAEGQAIVGKEVALEEGIKSITIH